MADTDLKITITTVSDVAGADKTSAALERVNASAAAAGAGMEKTAREVNIIDANQAASLTKKQEQQAAFAAWQKELQASRVGSTSAMASSVILAEERMAEAASLAAAQAALAAAELEAAEVKAALAAEAMAASTPKAAIGVAEMGNALGFAARAANDMTRGGRGMLGNVSHMLTALGGGSGIAAVAGAAAMGLVMLWPHLKKLWEDVEEPKRLEDWAKHLDELAASANKFANENAVGNFKDWIASLSVEKEAIKSNSDSLEHNIELIHARRRAQMEIDNAQGALDLAAIDADTTHTEAQKIAARAGVQERMDKAKEQNSLANIGGAPDKAARVSDKASVEARAAEAAAETARSGQRSIEKETADLTAKRNLAMAAENAIGIYKMQLEDAKSEEWKSQHKNLSPAERQAIKSKQSIAEQNISRANDAIGAYTQDDRDRLGNLDGSGKDSQKRRHLATAEAEQLTKQAKAAQAAAKEAFDAWKRATELAKIEAVAVQETYAREQAARGIATGAAVGRAEQKAASKTAAEENKAAREAAHEKEESAQQRLRNEAASDSSAFTHAGERVMDRGANKALTGIGKQLANGSTGDLRKIQTEFSQVSAKLTADTAATLQHMLDQLKIQADAIDVLKSQAKNNR